MKEELHAVYVDDIFLAVRQLSHTFAFEIQSAPDLLTTKYDVGYRDQALDSRKPEKQTRKIRQAFVAPSREIDAKRTINASLYVRQVNNAHLVDLPPTELCGGNSTTKTQFPPGNDGGGRRCGASPLPKPDGDIVLAWRSTLFYSFEGGGGGSKLPAERTQHLKVADRLVEL